MSISQRYGIDVTPVVRLFAVGRAAVAEKTRFLGVSAMAEVLDPVDAGGLEPRRDVAGKVEQGVVRPLGRPKKAPVCAPLGGEAGHELRPDLIVGLADH